jgi:hypothetical protein
VIEELVPDGLWERVAPLPPPKPRRHRYPGRRPIDDRAALAGIVFVLRIGYLSPLSLLPSWSWSPLSLSQSSSLALASSALALASSALALASSALSQ